MDPTPDQPTEPTLDKPLTLQEAYYHLYQLEKYDWEDDAQYAARKIARDDFEKQLAAAGVTIHDLLNSGALKPIERIIKPTLMDKLITRL